MEFFSENKISLILLNVIFVVAICGLTLWSVNEYMQLKNKMDYQECIASAMNTENDTERQQKSNGCAVRYGSPQHIYDR